jgi:hypothetical protein
MRKNKTLYDFFDSVGNLGEVALALHPLEEGTLEKWVLKSCVYSQSGVSARIPNADLLIDLSIFLCLTDIKKVGKTTMISLTDTGRHLLSFKQFERDRFTKQQGKFLLSMVLKKTDILNDLISVINIFNTIPNGDLWVDSHDTRIGCLENRILRLLQQLGAAKYSDGNIVIAKHEMEWLISMVSPNLHIDTVNLLDLLEIKRKHGELAEEFVLHKERERLINCNREDLSILVRKISDQNIAAGYDISSFDGKDSDVFYDRFIEVKGTTENQVLFYMSKNELETARRLRDKYWIYCVLNIETIRSKKSIMLRNPYKTIFQNKNFTVEPVLWRVCISK